MSAEALNATAAGEVTIGHQAVNRLGFGAMRITGDGIWGEPADPDGARALLRRVIELGIDLIDTADSYGPDVSERLIAEALYPYPEGLLIATKGGLLRDGPNSWPRNARPEHLREACEGSLRRLRVDRIDLYQLHRHDPEVPYEESVGALAELQQEGKIRDIGISNVDLDQLDQAMGIVEVVSVQNRFSIDNRESQPLLDACERHGIAFMPWFPLAAGRVSQITGALERIATDHGVTRPQLAIAWLLAHSPAMTPIPGTSNAEHLEQNVAAASIELSDAEMGELGG